MQKQFADLGSAPDLRSPAEVRKWMADERAYWAKVISDGNVKLD